MMLTVKSSAFYFDRHATTRCSSPPPASRAQKKVKSRRAVAASSTSSSSSSIRASLLVIVVAAALLCSSSFDASTSFVPCVAAIDQSFFEEGAASAPAYYRGGNNLKTRQASTGRILRTNTSERKLNGGKGKGTKSPSSRTKSPSSSTKGPKSTKSPKATASPTAAPTPVAVRGDDALFNAELDNTRFDSLGGVIFGGGNNDGGWAIDRLDGADGKTIEVALRAKIRYGLTTCLAENNFPNNENGNYVFANTAACTSTNANNQAAGAERFNWNFEVSVDVDKGCDTASATCRTIDDASCSYIIRFDEDPTASTSFKTFDDALIPLNFGRIFGTTSTVQGDASVASNTASNSNIFQISHNVAFFQSGLLFQGCFANPRSPGIYTFSLEATCNGETAETFINVYYGPFDGTVFPQVASECANDGWQNFMTLPVCPASMTDMVPLFASEEECNAAAAESGGPTADGTEWLD